MGRTLPVLVVVVGGLAIDLEDDLGTAGLGAPDGGILFSRPEFEGLVVDDLGGVVGRILPILVVQVDAAEESLDGGQGGDRLLVGDAAADIVRSHQAFSILQVLDDLLVDLGDGVAGRLILGRLVGLQDDRNAVREVDGFALGRGIGVNAGQVKVRKGTQEEALSLQVLDILLRDRTVGESVHSLGFNLLEHVVRGGDDIVGIAPETDGRIRAVGHVEGGLVTTGLEVGVGRDGGVVRAHLGSEHVVRTIPGTIGKRAVSTGDSLVQAVIVGEGQRIALGEERLFLEEILAADGKGGSGDQDNVC